MSAAASQSQFNTKVPGMLFVQAGQPAKAVDLSTGADIAATFQTEIVDPIDGIVNKNAADATTFLESLDGGLFSNVDVTNVDVSFNGSEWSFAATISITNDDTPGLFQKYVLDLGRNGDRLGLVTPQPESMPEVNLEERKIAFGFDVNVPVAFEEGNFVDPDGDGADPENEVKITANVDDFEVDGAVVSGTVKASKADLDNFALAVGFLDTTVIDGAFMLDAGVTSSFTDPNGGTFTYADLLSATFTAGSTGPGWDGTNFPIHVNNLGTFLADSVFPGGGAFDATHAALRFDPGPSPFGTSSSVIAGSDDPRTAPRIERSDAFAEFLQPFKNLGPSDILGRIEELGTSLQKIPGSEVMNLPIPFTNNQTLGQLFDVLGMLRKVLFKDGAAEKLVDKDGNPTFTSIQRLVQKLDDVVSGLDGATIAPKFVVNPDTSKKELLFTIKYDMPIPALADLPIGFNIPLGPLGGFSSASKISITPTGSVEFTLGMTFLGNEAGQVMVGPAVRPAKLTALLNGDGSAKTAADGQVSGTDNTLLLKLTLGGIGTADVTLNTTGNSTPANLRSDLQDAIDAAITVASLKVPGTTNAPTVNVTLDSLGRLVIDSPNTSFIRIEGRSTPTVPLATSIQKLQDKLGFVNDQQSSIAATPLNGVLSGNATFSLRIARNVIDVTVSQSANSSIDELVGDIQTAINDAITAFNLTATTPVTETVTVGRAGGSGEQIVLSSSDATALQITALDDVTANELGWHKWRIGGRLTLAGKDELRITASGAAPVDGKPGGTVTLQLRVDGQDVTVDVLAAPDASQPENVSDTSDNGDIHDLVADINLAIASKRLNGQNLGAFVTAGSIDTDGDGVNDRIILRGLTGVPLRLLAAASGIGFAGPQDGARLGPPSDGDLGPQDDTPRSAKFTISIDAETPIVVDVPDDNDNTTLDDLIEDINAALAAALLGTPHEGSIVAGRNGNRIIFAALDADDNQIRVNIGSDAAGQTARNELGFDDGQLARIDERVEFFVQDAQVKLGATLTAPDIIANGQFGFVGINVGGAAGDDGNVMVDFTVGLQDGETGSKRIKFDGIGSRIVRAAVKSDANVNPVLPGMATFTLEFGARDLSGAEGAVTTVNVAVDPDANNRTLADLALDFENATNAALEAAGSRIRVNVAAENGVLAMAVSALHASRLKITAANGVMTDMGFAVDEKDSTVIAAYSDAANDIDKIVKWGGSVTLGNVSVTGIPGLNISGENYTINIGNGSPIPKSFLPASFGPLDELSKLDFGDFLGALEAIADKLIGPIFSDPSSLLAQKIPVINKSLGELVPALQEFREVVQDFRNNPTGTLQELQSRLIEALGLESNSGLVQVEYDNHVLKVTLDFSEAFNESLPLDFDLGAANDFLSLKGAAGLSVSGAATVKLGVDVALSDITEPEVSLNLDPSRTKIGVDFAARGKDMTFTAAIGPVGIGINDGQVAIDGDGSTATTNDPLKFSVDLTGSATGDSKLTLDELDDFGTAGVLEPDVDFTGVMNATLPLFFPTESDFLGNIGVKILSIKDFIEGDTSSSNFQVEIPDLSQILENLGGSLFNNLKLLVDGVDFFLGELQSMITERFADVDLPVIGGSLEDAAKFIQDFRAGALSGLRNALDNAIFADDPAAGLAALSSSPLGALLATPAGFVRGTLFQVFGPSGLDLIKDGTDAGTDVSEDDIILEGNLDPGAPLSEQFVQWKMELGDEYVIGTGVDFDLGLPALGLEAAGDIAVTLDWSLDFGIGLDFNNGFYFMLNEDENDAELHADIGVELPDSLQGNLLFLKLKLENLDKDAAFVDDDSLNTPDTAGKSLWGALDVNIADTGAEPTRLGITELPSADVDADISATVDLDLQVTATVTPPDTDIGVLPAIETDFELTWNFSSDSAQDGLQYVGFNDIRLDLGSLFSDFLRPVIGGVEDITGPIQPLVDVLTSPIPVISDLAGEPFTLIDLASLFGDVNADLIEAIADIITLVNTIPDVAPGSNVEIPFGDIVIVNAAAAGLMAMSTSTEDLFKSGGFDGMELNDIPGVGDAISEFNFGDALNNSGADDQTKSFTEKMANGGFGEFISFPFLQNPSQIFGLLFGRPATLIALDLPPLELDFSYSQFFPIIGPLGAEITGSLGVKIDFAFGYDTFGFQKFMDGGFQYPLDIFRGFFISDRATPSGEGADVPEITLTGGLQGSAVLNLGVAKGGVGGGIFLTIGFNLNDPDNDGKVRIEEIVNNLILADFNPFGVFDIDALIEAKLTWAIEVLFVFKASGQIGPSLPLYEETFTIADKPALATPVQEEGGDKILRLSAGLFAGDRLRKDTNDGNEHFKVTESGDDWKVEAFLNGEWFDQTFDKNDFDRIEANLGAGNDRLELIGVTKTVEVEGGLGDDYISQSGSGAIIFRGGSGADTAIGGSGNDSLVGDKGADTLCGMDGDDTITGGDDADRISGDAGNDVLRGDGGADTIGGGADNDYVDGGDDADAIYGDSTIDCVSGDVVAPTGDGSDTLSGGDDNDTIRGEGGDDSIGGGAKTDLIEGGTGSDKIWGDSVLPEGFAADASKPLLGATPVTPTEEGGDRIFGLSETATNADADGDDSIFGEGRNDFIRGNAGNDTVEAGFGADTVFGDAGDDSLMGQSDGDTIFGGADDDKVIGGGGNDILFGDDGLVARLAAAGQPDNLLGDAPASLVSGLTGDADALSPDYYITYINSTTDGDDVIAGDAGEDVAFGGAGRDEVTGDIHPDDIASFLESNPNTPQSNDVIFGDGGLVHLINREFAQLLTVQSGDVHATDGKANDTIYGNSGNDVAFGGPGSDDITGRHGSQVEDIGNAEDADILLGDEGEVRFDVKPTDDVDGDGVADGFGDEVGGKADLSTADYIRTILPNVGDDDTIQGNERSDTAFGGTGDDLVLGDGQDTTVADGDDVLFGDHGQVGLIGGSIAQIKSIDVTQGGIDIVGGNTGADVAVGGFDGDFVHGDDATASSGAADGDDILLGDNAQLDYQLSSDFGFTFDATGAGSALDRIMTIAPTFGGSDQIFGNAGDDVVFGGTLGDLLYGDDTQATGTASATPGNDVIFGDHGRIYPQNSALADGQVNSRNFFAHDTGAEDGGAGDTLFGNEADDVMLGQRGDDLMFGNAGDDDMVGGHNVGADPNGGGIAIDELKPITPGDVTPDKVPSSDLMDGGAGNDAMAGDNAAIWRNDPAWTIQDGDTRRRFDTLNGVTRPDGSMLYDAAGNANVTGNGAADPTGGVPRTVQLLDHSTAILPGDNTVGAQYGNDIMAGGADDDAMFGQLGHDMIQGDGAIDVSGGFNAPAVQVFEGYANGAVTDGDDYVEGNGGDDMIIGNLGQDDLIGGSSDLFGLAGDVSLRPDGSDVIFGGAANALRLARLAYVGDGAGDVQIFGVGLVSRHAVDADMILGDNGRVFRILDGGGAYETFIYDQGVPGVEERGSHRVVVRAIDLLDYSPDPVDASIGAADVIHGESGDDSIHGMTGDDMLFGDSDDDDIFGEVGKDWISGGSGRDGILGDDGFLKTSRHGALEPLYGVNVATVEQTLATPGNFLITVLNPTDVLQKAADLEPFDIGGDDLIYGGLGDDSLHGGGGNDGMSGAEALAHLYYDPVSANDEATDRVEVLAAFNGVLRIVPRDNGVIITGFYNLTNALAKLDNHFLNFENTATVGSRQDPVRGDGHDVLFGDLGHDWLVGGTGRDHLYGGLGNDILDADDDKETNGGLNDVPDVGTLTPFENADTAYGGGGRDLLIGNTGADRLNDWVGEFNTFQVPFAPFGDATVQRLLAPHVPEFFYAISRSDGADQTRATGTSGSGSAIRNGEPYGELGLVLQQDKTAPIDWASQTGGPSEKQAGNKPGGRKDTRGDELPGGGADPGGTTTPVPVPMPATDQEIVENAFAHFAIRLQPGATPPLTLLSLPGIGLSDVTVLDLFYKDGEFYWDLL